MFDILCEYDIGQDGKVFQSREIALQFIVNNWIEGEVGDLQEAIDDGLVEVRPLQFIKTKGDL